MHIRSCISKVAGRLQDDSFGRLLNPNLYVVSRKNYYWCLGFGYMQNPSGNPSPQPGHGVGWGQPIMKLRMPQD